MSRWKGRAGWLGVALLLAGCGESEALVPETSASVELVVGETRTVQLRHTRFDVEGFVEEHTLEDLRRMPRRVLEDIWLSCRLPFRIRIPTSRLMRQINWMSGPISWS